MSEHSIPLTNPEPTRIHPSPALPRIGVVMDCFPAVSETFVLREIQQLLSDGVDLTLLAIRRPDRIVDPDAEIIAELVQYPPPPWSRSFWTLAFPEIRRPVFLSTAVDLAVELVRSGANGRQALALVRRLLLGAWMAGVLRRDGAGHVHAHFAGIPAVLARVASRQIGARYSISVHGSDLHHPSPYCFRNVKEAAFVLTCTAENQRIIRKRCSRSRDRIHLVYHGLDLGRFSPAPGVMPGSGAGTLDPVILCVARLTPKKGIDILVSACRVLLDYGLAFRCEILGDGPERQRLEIDIRKSGLEERVFLRGAATQQQTLEAYRRASLFVLPCRVAADGDRDGIPNVLVEAMAVGTPVISTPVGAVPELVEDGVTGCLVPPENAEALAEAIRRLLPDPAMRRALAAAGLARVRTDFDLGADRVRQIFELELARKE